MSGTVRMASAINNDYSANGISVATITGAGNALLTTIPQNLNRKGYFVQNQSAAQIFLVFDDSGGAATPTVMILGAGSGADTQGAASDLSGNPHHGRIRIYGTAGSQVAAADW